MYKTTMHQSASAQVLCGQCSSRVHSSEIVEHCPICGLICLGCEREHDWAVWRSGGEAHVERSL